VRLRPRARRLCVLGETKPATFMGPLIRRAFLQGMRLAAIEAARSGPAVPEQGGAVVCHSSAHLSVRTIQWISAGTIA
jgi:hypothetical protein